MNILVTGATGFVGFRLLQHLQCQGHKLLATGRDPVMGEKIRRLGIPFLPGDITHPDFAESLPPGQEAVIHLAGLSSPWGPYPAFYRANVTGTQNILRACFKHDVRRFVQLSSPSIYVDGTRSRQHVSEDEPLPPTFTNAYAQTKHLADQLVLEAAAQGLETVLLRPRAVIGAGDTVIVPRLLRAHAEGRLRIIGDGRNVVDLTGINNVCHGVDCALQASGEALGQAYNLSSGEPVRLWETLKTAFSQLDLKLNEQKIPFMLAYGLAKALEVAAKAEPGSPEPALTCYSVIMMGRSQTLNIDKARRLLGFTPVQTTTEALAEFISWWKRLHWL